MNNDFGLGLTVERNILGLVTDVFMEKARLEHNKRFGDFGGHVVALRIDLFSEEYELEKIKFLVSLGYEEKMDGLARQLISVMRDFVKEEGFAFASFGKGIN